MTTMTFPCGLPVIDPHTLSEADAAVLAGFHGWKQEAPGAEWTHKDRPDYGYASANEVVDDWSLWIDPDQVTSATLKSSVEGVMERKVMADYRAVVGKIILVDKIEGYKDEVYQSLDLPVPVFARVVAYDERGIRDDVVRWMDEWIDPIYDIELLPAGAKLPEIDTTHTYGKSYSTDGQVSPAHFVVPSDDFVARHMVKGGTPRKVEMTLFEITLAGFDGGTDETDDLVLWVAAPEAKIVEDALEGTGARFCGEVAAELENADYSLPGSSHGLQQAIRAADDAASPTAAPSPR